MSISKSIENALYLVFFSLTATINTYLIYINVKEIIQRSLGRHTKFSQMSWLTDKQAMFYCSFLTLLFIIFLTLLGHRLYQKNRKSAIRISLLTLSFTIAILLCETFLYNNPI